MTPGESHNEWYQYYCSNICPFKRLTYWYLSIILANRLHPDRVGQSVGPDLDPSCLTLIVRINERIFESYQNFQIRTSWCNAHTYERTSKDRKNVNIDKDQQT